MDADTQRLSPATCSLCQRTLSLDNDSSGDLETISICGDCKFLFLEDIESPSQVSRRSRPRRARRTRYSSSESVETPFSQQFSHMIDLVRQNQSTISGHENQHIDGDTAARTYTSGSRRWRGVLSDTESDGFDNLDSLYGESESNVSFGQYRVFHNDNDAISFDASVDDHSFLDMEAFAHPDSNFDSDTDIDPMHAGLDQWNSDDLEEEEDGEWVEDPELNGTDRLRAREGRETYARQYFDNYGDFLDARAFEEFLEHLAESDNTRRGAPPAALSYVNNLPLVIVNEDHLKDESLACAICKDALQYGSQVKQLPCFHLYHPSCIMPWLSSRNTCPLCRYELPTDDKEYEEEKQSVGNRVRVHEIQEHSESEDSSSEVDEILEHNNIDTTGSRTEGGRGRWFYFAAPIMSLVGIALVLWLDNNSLSGGRRRTGNCNLSQRVQGSVSSRSQSESRSRRWWSLL